MKKILLWSSSFVLLGFINPILSSSFLEIKNQFEDSEIRSNKIKYGNYPNLDFLEKKEVKNIKNNFSLPLELKKFLNVIPEKLELDILDDFKGASCGNRSKLLNYFIEKRLTSLTENIGEF